VADGLQPYRTFTRWVTQSYNPFINFDEVVTEGMDGDSDADSEEDLNDPLTSEDLEEEL
jgi:hypothetical protein